MNRPLVRAVFPTQDAARKALGNPFDKTNWYYRCQVAYLGKNSPDPAQEWGLVAPPADKGG